MTSNNTLSIDYISGGELPEDDPRFGFAQGIQLAKAVFGEITEENAGTATPCDDWTLQELAGHLIAVLDRVIVAPTGEDFLEMPRVVSVEIDGIPEALRDRAAAIHAAWSQPESLGRMINAPWGTVPGAAALTVWTGELIIHSWDAAVALGLEVNWPSGTMALTEGFKANLPAEPRGGPVPMAAVVPVSEDAAPIDQLVGWMGRDPHWRP